VGFAARRSNREEVPRTQPEVGERAAKELRGKPLRRQALDEVEAREDQSAPARRTGPLLRLEAPEKLPQPRPAVAAEAGDLAREGVALDRELAREGAAPSSPRASPSVSSPTSLGGQVS
jgi:hypothetical protein